MAGEPAAAAVLLGAMALLAGCDRPEERQAAAEVEISGWSWGFSYTGEYCQGRGFVRNKGDEPVGNISFQVRLLDAKEKTVATGPGRMEKRMLEAGEGSPFGFFLPCPASSSAAELTATHGLDKPVTVRMKS